MKEMQKAFKVLCGVLVGVILLLVTAVCVLESKINTVRNRLLIHTEKIAEIKQGLAENRAYFDGQLTAIRWINESQWSVLDTKVNKTLDASHEAAQDRLIKRALAGKF